MMEFAAAVVWLMLAGYGFRVFGNGAARGELVGMFVACLLLAPFAAGAALADQMQARR